MRRFTTNGTHQWCDTKLVMVVDSTTGKPEMFGDSAESLGKIGTLADASQYVKRRKGWEDRLVIVELNCISGFLLA